jgi:hypothetical protein
LRFIDTTVCIITNNPQTVEHYVLTETTSPICKSSIHCNMKSQPNYCLHIANHHTDQPVPTTLNPETPPYIRQQPMQKSSTPTTLTANMIRCEQAINAKSLSHGSHSCWFLPPCGNDLRWYKLDHPGKVISFPASSQ